MSAASPPPRPTHAFVPFVMNVHPFYETLELRAGRGPDSATVDAILEQASALMGYRSRFKGLSLRWITDESAAFIPQNDSDLDRRSLRSRQNDARAWYLAKGHCLASEPIDANAALRKRLRCRGSSTTNAQAGEPVRLYVVAPPSSTLYWDSDDGNGVEAIREGYIWNRCPDEIRHKEDSSILTRMAALYEPAFAYAESALRGLEDIPLGEGGAREPGNATTVNFGAAVDGGKVEDVDDTVDGRLFMTQLHDAFGAPVKAGRSASDTDLDANAEEGVHAVALGKVLQLLFDDPTLTVKVNSWVEIEATCSTPYCIPAFYVLGRHLRRALPHDAECGVREGMLAYRDATVKRERSAIYNATCCPCLVIGIAGATLQVFAAYLADEIFRTHLCDFALDADDREDPGRVAAKVRVVRNAARMLRSAYAKVHISESLRLRGRTCRPHLLPQPAMLMPAPLRVPLHLSLLDRVYVGMPYSDIFTGVLRLPGVHATDCGDNDDNDDDDDDDNDDDEESEAVSASTRGLPVHVKFVEEYGVEAHRLLAEHRSTADGAPWPLAPQLYWAGEIVAGLLMIVMETLPRDARMLFQYSSSQAADDGDDAECGPPVAWGELEDVCTAVQLLPAHGFVHGDVRPGNIMLQRPPRQSDDSSTGAPANTSGGGGGGTNASRAYLIDFDGAGKEGEARYAAGLNSDVQWPRPASELGGQLITKDDDVFMLERLLPRVSQESEHERERGDNVDRRKRERERDDTDERKRKRNKTDKQTEQTRA